MKKSENAKNKAGKQDNDPRKPFAPLYFLACMLTRGYFKLFYRLSIDKTAIKDIKGPVIVLSNHQSNLDFLIVALTAYPLKLNFMVTTYFFKSTVLRFLLKLMGAFPKKQFIPDASAIKGAMKVSARGGNIAIFPEGQVCYNGTNCDIEESIAKLIKKLGVTTINISIRGNHLTCPKWSRTQKVYRGKIESKAEVLFTPSQIEQLSADEIANKTVDALAYNEYEWQRGRMAQYRPSFRETAGLESVIYRCPKCQNNFTINTRNNEVFCEKCGYNVYFDSYGFFKTTDGTPPVCDNPAAWGEYQKEVLTKNIEHGTALPFETQCLLHKTVKGKHGYTKCGEGKITLNGHGVFFEGTADGEPIKLSALYERQSNLPFNGVRSAIDLHGESENYAAEPLDHRHMLYIVEGYAIKRRIETEKRNYN